MIRMLIFAAAFVWPMAAVASDMTGNKLLAECNDRGNFSNGVCLGYIRASVDSHDAAVQFYGATKLFCIPPTVTVGQTISVVMKYLEANPADRHYIATSLIVVAVAKAWPCSR